MFVFFVGVVGFFLEIGEFAFEEISLEEPVVLGPGSFASIPLHVPAQAVDLGIEVVDQMKGKGLEKLRPLG